MRDSCLSVLSLAFTMVVCACLTACPADEDDGTGQTQGDVGADASVTEDSGASDTTASDMMSADAAPADLTLDTVGDETGPADPCETVNTECFAAAPSVGMGTPRLVFQFVDVANSIVEIKNLSTDSVSLDGFQLCVPFAYEALPNGITLNAGDTLMIDLAGEGSGEVVGLGNSGLALANAGEVMLYANDDDFGDASNVTAYVRWGDATTGSSRIETAVEAGLWPEAGFVPLCGNNSELSAVGSVDTVAGWTDEPSSCPEE